MTLFAAIVLFLNAAFNVVAWPRFFLRVSKDARARDAAGAPTAFLRLHAALLGVALLLALASVIVGVLVLL
jgi:hypothetical protein